jgi:hypothetical protein
MASGAVTYVPSFIEMTLRCNLVHKDWFRSSNVNGGGGAGYTDTHTRTAR